MVMGLVVIQGIKPLGRECSCYVRKQKKFQYFQQSKKREYRNSISYYFIYTFPYPLSIGNHFQHFPIFPTNAPATKKPGITPGSKAIIHPVVSCNQLVYASIVVFPDDAFCFQPVECVRNHLPFAAFG